MMSYAMLAVLTDPEHAEIVKKMREELDANLGQEPIRLSEKHKIPYCEAVSEFMIIIQCSKLKGFRPNSCK